MNQIETIETMVPLDFFNQQKNLGTSENLKEMLDLETPVKISLREKSIEKRFITYLDIKNYVDPETSELDIVIFKKLGGIINIRSRLIGLGEFIFILQNQNKEGFPFRTLNHLSHRHYSYFFISGDCGIVFAKLATEGYENKPDDLNYLMSLDVFNFEYAKTEVFKKMFSSNTENRHTFYLKY